MLRAASRILATGSRRNLHRSSAAGGWIVIDAFASKNKHIPLRIQPEIDTRVVEPETIANTFERAHGTCAEHARHIA